jgi:hypothetical protein
MRLLVTAVISNEKKVNIAGAPMGHGGHYKWPSPSTVQKPAEWLLALSFVGIQVQ